MDTPSLENIEPALPYDAIPRKDLAKIMVNFAVNDLGYEKTESPACRTAYDDISGVSEELTQYIIRACSMGVMGLESDGETPLTSFMPESLVTRAEFATTLSRVLYDDTYDAGYIGSLERYQ